MSSSQQIFGNKNPSKSRERPSFAHTCNLLTQYVKEKGGLKELNLAGLGGKLEATPAKSNVTTMDLMLLNKSEALDSTEQVQPVEPSRISEEDPKRSSSRFVFVLLFYSFPLCCLVIRKARTLADGELPFRDLFTFTSLRMINKASDSFHRFSVDEAAVEPKTAQMTIFYAGEVLVFDDFPAKKAREIVLMASNESSGGDLAASKGKTHCSADVLAPSSMAAPNSISTLARERPRPQSETNNSGSDLPIARRASVNRFLEKRKDRNVARGPYHQAQNAQASSSKNDEQLELKL